MPMYEHANAKIIGTPVHQWMDHPLSECQQTAGTLSRVAPAQTGKKTSSSVSDERASLEQQLEELSCKHAKSLVAHRLPR